MVTVVILRDAWNVIVKPLIWFCQFRKCVQCEKVTKLLVYGSLVAIIVDVQEGNFER